MKKLAASWGNPTIRRPAAIADGTIEGLTGRRPRGINRPSMRTRWVSTLGMPALFAACSADHTGPPPLPQPTQLAFVVQPGQTLRDSVIAPSITVEVRGASGSRIAGATNTVTLALGTNPSGAALTGTTSVAAVDGIATFAILRVTERADLCVRAVLLGIPLPGPGRDRQSKRSADFPRGRGRQRFVRGSDRGPRAHVRDRGAQPGFHFRVLLGCQRPRPGR